VQVSGDFSCVGDLTPKFLIYDSGCVTIILFLLEEHWKGTVIFYFNDCQVSTRKSRAIVVDILSNKWWCLLTVEEALMEY
jgi:squalene cyclase